MQSSKHSLHVGQLFYETLIENLIAYLLDGFLVVLTRISWWAKEVCSVSFLDFWLLEVISFSGIVVIQKISNVLMQCHSHINLEVDICEFIK